MGVTKASIKDFNNLVRITSRGHDESVEDRIRYRISSTEAGSKLAKNSGFRFSGLFCFFILPVDGFEFGAFRFLKQDFISNKWFSGVRTTRDGSQRSMFV